MIAALRAPLTSAAKEKMAPGRRGAELTDARRSQRAPPNGAAESLLKDDDRHVHRNPEECAGQRTEQNALNGLDSVVHSSLDDSRGGWK